MSIRLRFWTLLLALALCPVAVRIAWAQGQAESKDQSHAQAAADTSKSPVNSSKAVNPAKNDSLRDLEDQIFRSFKAPPPKGPLNGSASEPPPQATPSTKNKRAKELQDRKDWIFMQPEELMAVPTVEELLNLAPLDKKERSKEKLSPLENYLDRVYHPDGPNRKKEHYGDLTPFGSPRKDKYKDPEKDPAPFYGGADQTDSDELPDSVRDTQHNLKKKLSESEQRKFGVVSPGENRSFFSDIFGLDAKAKELPTPQEMEAQKQRMDQFKALYGFQAAPPGVADSANPLTGLVQFTPSVAKSTAPTFQNSSASPAANNLSAPAPVGIAPLPDPNALPGVANFTIPAPFAPPLPKTETRTVPPMPNFNAPRRQF